MFAVRFHGRSRLCTLPASNLAMARADVTQAG